MDLIYKEIINLFSDIAGNSSWGGKEGNQNEVKLLPFFSVSGGVGASTSAAACAINLAAKQHNVLYLNLEDFGTSNIFFNAEGTLNLGDILFALKSKKSNVLVKIKSSVKRDATGVYFFDPCRMPLDMKYMNQEDYSLLFDELKKSQMFNYIVVDAHFTLHNNWIYVLKNSSKVIFVTDGESNSDYKLNRMIDVIRILEKQNSISICEKMILLQNKYGQGHYLATTEAFGLGVLGYVGLYNAGAPVDIARQIALTDIFSRL